MNELWNKYQEYMFKLSSYNLVLTTTYQDSETIAPSKGNDYRNKRMAYVDGEVYSLQTSDELLALLQAIISQDDLTVQQKQIAKWQLKDLLKIKSIPKEVFVRNSQLSIESQQAWTKAKQTSDYKLFEPYLLKVIEMQKEMLSYRKDGYKGYDALLDDYEPNMNMQKYDEFFGLIRSKIVPLIKEISQAEPIDDNFAYQYYPAEKQKELAKKIMEYIDFDFEAGILAESEHPFTNSIQKYDNRITTHYYEYNLFSSIFSIIHESGHANYNYQVSDELAETYVFNNMSSGMHESQSRLYENYLGRSYHFWDYLFNQAKEIFPQQLANVDQSAFVRAANKVQPSLVRTEADELTYPLHIMVRYEMERDIFNGTIDLTRLKEIWDEKYEEYLGIKAVDVKEGILQDIHWSSGSFGYFPTYALGSGYAAQFMAAMNKDIDVQHCLANNNFKEIKQWLKEHIDKYGGINMPSQQIAIATGQPFDPNYYVEYLTNKYRGLYHLDK